MDKKKIVMELLDSLIDEMEMADIRPLKASHSPKPMAIIKEEKMDAIPLDSEEGEEELKEKLTDALGGEDDTSEDMDAEMDDTSEDMDDDELSDEERLRRLKARSGR